MFYQLGDTSLQVDALQTLRLLTPFHLIAYHVFVDASMRMGLDQQIEDFIPLQRAHKKMKKTSHQSKVTRLQVVGLGLLRQRTT